MKLSAYEHARQLYADALRSLARFRAAKLRIDDAVKRAKLQAVRDARSGTIATRELEKLIDQIADRDPDALEATAVAARNRDEATMFALLYLMESDYIFRTEPFGLTADAMGEMRGESGGK